MNDTNKTYLFKIIKGIVSVVVPTLLAWIGSSLGSGDVDVTTIASAVTGAVIMRS